MWLNLAKQDLQLISDDLCELKNLKRLELQYNNLVSLPDCIGEQISEMQINGPMGLIQLKLLMWQLKCPMSMQV